MLAAVAAKKSEPSPWQRRRHFAIRRLRRHQLAATSSPTINAVFAWRERTTTWSLDNVAADVPVNERCPSRTGDPAMWQGCTESIHTLLRGPSPGNVQVPELIQ